MTGAVSTVAINGEEGFPDGAGAAALFNTPNDLVVGGEGVIVVAGTYNNRLRKVVGGQVTTLTGSSAPGTADGAGAVARVSTRLARWHLTSARLLVAEFCRKDTLRVVEASLAPLVWMRKTRRRRSQWQLRLRSCNKTMGSS
jgi:hypothetical protein